MTEDEAKKLLVQSVDAITWLLLAWSRYENEYRTHPSITKIREVREEWGRRLAEYVEDKAFKAASLFEDEEDTEDEDGA